MLSAEEVAKNRQIMRYGRAWIKFLSLTQSKIAILMNVSEPTVSNWLSGKQSMSTAQLVELSEKLGIDVATFLTAPGDKAQAVRVRRLIALAQSITDDELSAVESLISRKGADKS